MSDLTWAGLVPRYANLTLTLVSDDGAQVARQCDVFEPPVVLRMDTFKALTFNKAHELTEFSFLHATHATATAATARKGRVRVSVPMQRFPHTFVKLFQPPWKQHYPSAATKKRRVNVGWPASGSGTVYQFAAQPLGHARYVFARATKVVRVVRDVFDYPTAVGGTLARRGEFLGIKQWWLVPTANHMCGRPGAVWSDVSNPKWDEEPICMGHLTARMTVDVLDFYNKIDPGSNTGALFRGGSAFGALRFKATLPWDQDVDIMPCPYNGRAWGDARSPYWGDGSWCSKGQPEYDFGFKEGMYRGFPRWPVPLPEAHFTWLCPVKLSFMVPGYPFTGQTHVQVW